MMPARELVKGNAVASPLCGRVFLPSKIEFLGTMVRVWYPKGNTSLWFEVDEAQEMRVLVKAKEKGKAK
jgi:hypothetical protein